MVPVLARMSVIIKADHESNIITGNYEMAYICGLIHKLSAKVPEGEFQNPVEMHKMSVEICESHHTEDSRELNLIRMLKLYKPDSTYDSQVKELFQMGISENNLWKKLA